MSMDRSTRGRFRELDVLRGLAALSVVVFHYSRHGTRYFSGYPFDFWVGKYGVHLFFVISGFVIYYTLERSRTVGDFLFSRFSRLFPAYWVALAILILLSVLSGAERIWWNGYLVNATMLQKFVGFPDVDDVYWTLGVELAFYALMTAAFFLGLMRRIVLVGFVWLLAAAAWGFVHHYTDPDERSIATTYLILPYAPYFITGVMFYLIHARGAHYTYIGMIGLAWAVALLVHGFTVAWITLAIFAAVAMAVGGWLRLLANPVTLWLGAISYPLYLVHRLLGYAFLDWMNARHSSYLLAFAIAVGGALALGHLLSVSVERPSMRVLRDWYRRTDIAAAAAPLKASAQFRHWQRALRSLRRG